MKPVELESPPGCPECRNLTAGQDLMDESSVMVGQSPYGYLVPDVAADTPSQREIVEVREKRGRLTILMSERKTAEALGDMIEYDQRFTLPHGSPSRSS